MNQLTKREKLEQVTPWVDKFWACKSINALATERLLRHKPTILLSVFDRVQMQKDPVSRVPEPFTVRVLRKRAEALRIPFTEAAFCALGLGLLGASPATAVMYLTAIKHVYITLVPAEPITSQMLLEDYLENRIIGQDELNQLWQEQKRDGYNLLDTLGPDDFLMI